MEFEKDVFRKNVVPDGLVLEADTTPRKTAYTRKNEASATAAERKRYREGIEALIADGSYGELVAIHIDMSHRQHTMSGPVGSQRFLSWHRAYLLRLEERLRQRDPAAFIPYWDWTQNRGIPDWMTDFTPTVRLPDGTDLEVTRNPGGDAEINTLPEKSAIDQLMEHSTYLDFTLALEGARPFGAHNQVHVWIGGVMNTMASPADPIFFLHHAQVDRLWSLWQAKHSRQKPRLRGRDSVLDPWEDTAADMNDIAELGYAYAKTRAAAGTGV